jgi:hypothetical protein
MNPALSRRGALAGALPALAVASLPPAATAASIANPDADLLSLQAEVEAADADHNTALAAFDRADDVYSALRSQPPEDSPDRDDDEMLARVRTLIAEYKLPSSEPFNQAVTAWRAEDERLKHECGVVQAEADVAARCDKVAEVRARITATPATTIRGLIFKARYAAEHYPEDYDVDTMQSIVDDLVAMGAQS